MLRYSGSLTVIKVNIIFIMRLDNGCEGMGGVGEKD